MDEVDILILDINIHEYNLPYLIYIFRVTKFYYNYINQPDKLRILSKDFGNSREFTSLSDLCLYYLENMVPARPVEAVIHLLKNNRHPIFFNYGLNKIYNNIVNSKRDSFTCRSQSNSIRGPASRKIRAILFDQFLSDIRKGRDYYVTSMTDIMIRFGISTVESWKKLVSDIKNIDIEAQYFCRVLHLILNARNMQHFYLDYGYDVDDIGNYIEDIFCEEVSKLNRTSDILPILSLNSENTASTMCGFIRLGIFEPVYNILYSLDKPINIARQNLIVDYSFGYLTIDITVMLMRLLLEHTAKTEKVCHAIVSNCIERNVPMNISQSLVEAIKRYVPNPQIDTVKISPEWLIRIDNIELIYYWDGLLNNQPNKSKSHKLYTNIDIEEITRSAYHRDYWLKIYS